MEDQAVLRLIGQYLTEHKYTVTLSALEKESGRKYTGGSTETKGELQTILNEYDARVKQKREIESCVEFLFSQGEGEYANELWCSFNDLTGGLNVLVVRLIENGVVAFGSPKSQLGTIELPLPLDPDCPPITPIPNILTASGNPKGAILALDFHPTQRNLLVCGTMDRLAHIVDIDNLDEPVLQSFENHTKYVVRALWSPSGKYFITGSYDHTVCVYSKKADSSSEYELTQRVEISGAVESLTFAKGEDVFVVGARNNNHLLCFDLTSGKATKTRSINMNAFGDDFVSFVAMHTSFSPDGMYILVSTDKDRLIIYSWESGKQIANFYGAMNDEYSQPRHCWDPSGRYIYGTSQDKSIVVWEIKSQSIVTRLIGHTGVVRDVQFCSELNILISCGFDGSIRMWRNTSSDSD
ncbi:WD repeat-containing protein 5B-like [Halichondria panicea]|uniref:WD repeat-containing protein 5B-like n=1 Tax=Halichondria panicea TaxID=6063 RepID=UPI00312BAC5A